MGTLILAAPNRDSGKATKIGCGLVRKGIVHSLVQGVILGLWGFLKGWFTKLTSTNLDHSVIP